MSAKKYETYNEKYASAVNLLHLFVYHKDSRELLYAYSSPGLKVTPYLTNSLLQSISMSIGMPVEFEEIYLQDDISLTLTDGIVTRIAVFSKNLPSIEMQKQILRFIDFFEENFKDKIPEAVNDMNTVNRMINVDVANNLIEQCFEKSLTFPHIAQRPRENETLTTVENRLHKVAYNLNEKSGPFLLGRLLALAQMETGITDLSNLIKLVFQLREKEALKPVLPEQAARLKEAMMREKFQTKKDLKVSK